MLSSFARKLTIGPSADGLWIVRDADGVCGAVFKSRDEALHFVREESAAARPAPVEWRLVDSLDLASIFGRKGG